MIAKLDNASDQITFVSFDHPRGSKVEDLFEISHNLNKYYNSDWKQAIEEELQIIKIG